MIVRTAMFLIAIAGGVIAETKPSWKLPVVGGGVISLESLRGQVVVVSFGATWCPPCREELPALQALAEKYREHPVKVYWISVDGPDVPDEVIADFAREAGLKVPVLRDKDASVYDQFGEDGVPLVIVIDQQGARVGSPRVGFPGADIFLEELSQVIDSLLKNEPFLLFPPEQSKRLCRQAFEEANPFSSAPGMTGAGCPNDEETSSLVPVSDGDIFRGDSARRRLIMASVRARGSQSG